MAKKISLTGSRKEGNVYQNLVPTGQPNFGKMLKILWQGITNKAENTPKKQIGPFNTDTSVYNKAPESGLRITWIGHSSLLIEIDGKRILTDPVWGARASFSQKIGPKRFFNAPLPLNDLPKLDAIIISHDHYDHFDETTIRYFADKQIPFYCSLGVGDYLKKWGIPSALITEMDWGDTARIGLDCTITTTPARHFSGRGLTNHRQTLWSAFVIKGHTHHIFFGADSGWFDGFAAIGDAYGPFDLTMLEIGAYGKYWPDIHMGPDSAAKAHLALKGKVMMPIHWGTFNLAPHAWYEPIERLMQIAKEKHITLFSPQPGLPSEVVADGLITDWWKKFMS